MNIKSIQFSNFKIFSDKLLSFTNRIEISGRNGSGKSSIEEAIIFALYNRTLNGGKDTDRFIKKGEDFCEVTLSTDKGKIKRRRGKTTKIWLEDKEISQENLEKELDLPDFEIFNSIFNTGYFMTLDETTQRQIILDLTEDVDMVELFKKLGGEEEDIEKHEINFDDIEKTYKDINSKKLLAKETLRALDSELEIMEKELVTIPTSDIRKLKGGFTDLEKSIKEEESKEKEVTQYINDRKLYDSMLPLIEEKKELEKYLLSYTTKECFDMKGRKTTYKEKIERNNKGIEILNREIISLPKGLDCPVCSQKISKAYKDKIEESNKKTETMITELKKIVETCIKDDEVEREFDIKKKKLTILNSQIPKDLVEPTQPKAGYTDKKFNELKEELNTMHQSVFKAESDDQRKKYLEQNIIQQKETIIEIGAKAESLQKLVDIFSPKGLQNEEMKLKLKPLKDRLQKEVEGIDIILLELLKSGMGYKKVFKILVDDIDYLRRSTGEKRKIDVAISLILNDLLKEKYNNPINTMFVDGMESLSYAMNFKNGHESIQLFLAKVLDDDLVVKNL